MIAIQRQCKLFFLFALLTLSFSCNEADDNRIDDDLETLTLDCTNITADKTLKKAIYIVDCEVLVTNDAILTIDAGSIFKFGTSGGFKTTNGGGIKALGASDKRITFTGKQDVPGSWKGLKIFSNTNNNQFAYCDFSYGGAASGALISVGDYGYATAYYVNAIGRLNMTNSTIKYSAGAGVHLGKTSILDDFESNVFADNAFPLVTYWSEIGNIPANNNYGDSLNSYVKILVNQVSTDFTIPKLNVPYLLFDDNGVKLYIIDNVAATVEPGVKLVMGTERILLIKTGGTLNATGTATQKITITGKQQVAGYWGQLFFEDTNSPLNKLEYCIIEYGGGAKHASDVQNSIVCAKGINNQVRLSIKNSRISHSAGYGFFIYEHYVSSFINDVATNCPANSNDVYTALMVNNQFEDNSSGNYLCQ